MIKIVFEKKVLQCRKTKRDPLRLFNIYSVAEHQKIEGGTLWGFFFEKSLTMPKKSENGDPLVSPGIVYYAEKHKKPFWFSSLSQMFQFGTIKFR